LRTGSILIKEKTLQVFLYTAEQFTLADCMQIIYDMMPSLPRPPKINKKGPVAIYPSSAPEEVPQRSVAVGSLVAQVGTDLDAAFKATIDNTSNSSPTVAFPLWNSRTYPVFDIGFPENSPPLDPDIGRLGRPAYGADVSDRQLMAIDSAMRHMLHQLSYIDLFAAAVSTQASDVHTHVFLQQQAKILSSMTATASAVSASVMSLRRQACLKNAGLDHQFHQALMAQPWSAKTLFNNKVTEVVADSQKEIQSTATVRALQAISIVERKRKSTSLQASKSKKRPFPAPTARPAVNTTSSLSYRGQSANRRTVRGRRPYQRGTSSTRGRKPRS